MVYQLLEEGKIYYCEALERPWTRFNVLDTIGVKLTPPKKMSLYSKFKQWLQTAGQRPLESGTIRTTGRICTVSPRRTQDHT